MTEQVRRATRLVEIERRLRSNPRGLSVRELSEMLGYSPRTIQRDINVLESELGVPLMEAPGRRWRLMPGSSPIGAVRFSIHEARAVYLATRLFLRHADERDPDGVSALDKLADALPPGLGRFVRDAADELRDRPANPSHTDHIRVLTSAWADSRRVELHYRSATHRSVRQTVLDPYLLEPSATGAATYVYGFSEAHKSLRTFKLDRIVEAHLTDELFSPPDVAELRARIAASWGGTVVGDDQFDVVLEFAPEVASRVAETNWHRSQRLTPAPDGSLRFEVRLPSLLEFAPWVRSWGDAVLVVAPSELRDDIAASMQRAAARYA
ncbi:MAG: helix-turn-helix transcriptional regulator [Dehalococcoidia bacterium]